MLGLSIAGGLLASGWGGDARAATVTLACGAVGIEYEDCRAAAEEWGAQTGNTVLTFPMPNNSAKRLDLYRAVMAEGTGKIDVFLIDVVWPAVVGDDLIDLRPYLGEAAKDHVQEIIENNTVDGELKAIPMFMDAGYLLYRRDLLDKYGREVPKTWDELADTARLIQEGERGEGNTELWGLVFQGRDYEGLTCNALEWIYSHGGGRIVEPDGTVTINNPRAVAALDKVAGWMGDIVSPDVLDYDEEETRYAFQAGNAVFMRNWPYVWTLLNSPLSAVSGDVGIAPLPGGSEGHAAGTLGGWQLGVSKASANPKEAADLIGFLTSRKLQKERAIEASYGPSRPDLYRDPELQAAVDFLPDVADLDFVYRPSTTTGTAYNAVSQVFSAEVHALLSGRTDAATAAQTIEGALEELKAGAW
ncbi:ABC transporter substrate-binding protein [Acuticoccus sp. 2012]|uniref:ABC transporter substrate-binding protein n=2 Tax=Acuticoccus mangrovi TaxID=2796142 RepID=A0A934IP91_9HYPH|nr:ABC transporter substrate-binding protein [Acuticoccus mangrovi]